MTHQENNPEVLGDDSIIRALALGESLRVVATVASSTCNDICRRHNLTGVAAVGLSRATVAGSLLATLTKQQSEVVTLKVIAEPSRAGFTVDARSTGQVRGYPNGIENWPDVAPGTRADVAKNLGTRGLVSVARDLGLRDTFSGSTEFVSGNVDKDVEGYLIKSEQIDSVMVCDAVADDRGHISRAAGVLLQAMPGSPHQALLEALRGALHEGEFFSALSAHAPSGNAASLVRSAIPDIADTLRVLDTRPVEFFCPCSRERAESTLGLLGKDDLLAIISNPGSAEVVCEFCQTRYHFTAENLQELHARLCQDAPASKPS